MNENGHVMTDALAGEQHGARRPLEHNVALVLHAALRTLTDRLHLWVTLFLASGMWAFAAWTIATKPHVAYTPLIVTATLFTLFVHVPTWTLWKRGR